MENNDSASLRDLCTIQIVPSSRSSSLLRKYEPPTVRIPPQVFIQRVSNFKWYNHPKYSFLLYSMNHVHLSLEYSSVESQPFELFKDCYNGTEEPFYGAQRYFVLTNRSTEISEKYQDNDDRLDGTTMLSIDEDTLTGQNSSEPKLAMVILPKILLFNKTTENLYTESIIKSHINCFRTVFLKYKKVKISNLFINLVRLVESYLIVIFKDITIKWLQWDSLFRKINISRRTAISSLYEKLTKIFWVEYFIFMDSSKYSLDAFTDKLKSLANTADTVTLNSIYSGIWLDSSNGILIFGSSILSKEFSEIPIIHSLPILGISIDDSPINEIINKLLLFINFAVLECFKKEALDSEDLYTI